MTALAFDPWAALKMRGESGTPPNPPNPPNCAAAAGPAGIGGLGTLGGGAHSDLTFRPAPPRGNGTRDPLVEALIAWCDDDPAARERERAAALAWAEEQGRAAWPGFVTDPAALPAASPDQAKAERQDRAAIAAEGAPIATVPVEAGTLAAWEGELAELLAAVPAQRITDPDRACDYFMAEARRRLARVKHDRQAAGLLLLFWRHAREART